jgi:pimeloyl-ACP methyl ester carboxylesterase
MAPVTEVGVLRDRLPYLRIGRSGPPLVVLPGLALSEPVPHRLLRTAYARGFRRLADEHTLYIVQRPHGLPRGTSTADLAAEYADVLRPELGRFALMGFSTGGLIAQHLALAEPAVERLALVVAGARIDEAGRERCARWLTLAAEGRWRALYGDLAASAVDGRVAQRLARTVVGLSGRRPTDEERADFVTTVRAVLAHDTRGALGGLRVPALVVGGALDPFFPEAALRATADAIPDARLIVFPGNGHGVPKHRAAAMQEVVAAFLARSR